MSAPSALRHPHLFGPVFSRRLGRSLGIDLLPYKTCSLDCIYCECGATSDLTTVRAEYVPAGEVVAELDAYLAGAPELDYVTFSGSGEPTLHSGLGQIIRHLKAHHPRYRVAVLTNGTLFREPQVREMVRDADLVIPSLDGATPESFAAINRPAADVRLDDVITGLVALRGEVHGTFVLEVFVVPGVNDTPREVDALRQAAELIRPDAIQLNRLDRPGIDPGLTAAGDEVMERIAAALRPMATFVVPRRQAGEVRRLDDDQVERAIVARLEGRERDVTTLAFLLGLHEGLVAKNVNQMLADGRLVRAGAPGVPPQRLVVRVA